MRKPDTLLGYCTNVHPGTSYAQVKEQLLRHAVPVQQTFCPDRPLPIGLWLSHATANEILQGEHVHAFRRWLSEHNLRPYSLNGFPYSNFHQPVVKHAVYTPAWNEMGRLRYTNALARILEELLSKREEGSISTLPISWNIQDEVALEAATLMIRGVANDLHTVFEQSGRLLHVDLEPEPGCTLSTSADAIRFFDQHLSDERSRRYIRICHDVCHAAVMGENQAEVLAAYEAADIQVGKVQISSAPMIDWNQVEDKQAALIAVRELVEPRYLHQTTIERDGELTFYEDLPDALDAEPPEGIWRVHFHLPVYLQHCGPLGTTQDAIRECLQAVDKHRVRHYEVETYAWNVLPSSLAEDSLAAGIAKELQWVQDLALL